MGKTKITPLQDRVLLKVDGSADKTKSGIIIPDTAKDKEPMKYGTVVGFGEKVKNLKEGDHVGFMNGAGTEFTHEEEKFLIIRDVDLIVKLAGE